MTLAELEAMAERLPEMERRIAELERSAHNDALGYTIAEVATRFLPGVHESTIRDWIKSGELVASLTPGGRVYLVQAEDLREFLARLKRRDPAEQRSSVESNIRRILGKQPKKAS